MGESLYLGVPVINSLLLITSLAGWTSFSWLGLSFGIFLVLSFGIIKRATYIQETYGKQLKSLNGYARLIALAKAENWKSAGMQELMERFNLNGQSPIQALQQLSKELDRLDLRNNQFLYVLLEGSIFFQLQEIVRIERWKVRYGQHISEWLETVGELDALCSLGTFAYNHPQYTNPELTEKPFCFLATQMGHPYASFTMREKRCHHSVASVFPDYYRSQYGRKKHLPENYRRELPAGLYWSPRMLRKAQALPESAHYQPAHL